MYEARIYRKTIKLSNSVLECLVKTFEPEKVFKEWKENDDCYVDVDLDSDKLPCKAINHVCFKCTFAPFGIVESHDDKDDPSDVEYEELPCHTFLKKVANDEQFTDKSDLDEYGLYIFGEGEVGDEDEIKAAKKIVRKIYRMFQRFEKVEK